MIVAVDFDGTLMDPTNVRPGYRMGEPVPGAVAAINRLHQRGDTIVIFTARNVIQKEPKLAVAKWLEYFHIPFDEITNIKKPYFDVMIDNRGLRFDGNWAVTLGKVDKLLR